MNRAALSGDICVLERNREIDPPSLSPLKLWCDQWGRGTRGHGGCGVSPSLPPGLAPTQPSCRSVHTQSLLFPLAQHLDVPNMCARAHTVHTCHTHRVRSSQCYLCSQVLVHTQPCSCCWCTPGAHSLLPFSRTRHMFCPGAHTLSCCCLAHGTRSVPVHTHSLMLLSHTPCTLTPRAHSLFLLSHPWRTPRSGSRSLLLPSHTLHMVHAHPWCTLALATISYMMHTHPTDAPLSHPHPLFTPSPTPRGAAGAPRSHLTMPYMTRTFPSSPTTHTTE